VANAGPSILANMASQKARRVKAATQMGLTPAYTPPQAGQTRGSVPPTKAATTSPPSGDVFLSATMKFFEELSGWQP